MLDTVGVFGNRMERMALARVPMADQHAIAVKDGGLEGGADREPVALAGDDRGP